MNWRRLAVVVGLATIAIYLYRRRGRRAAVDVAIEEFEAGDQQAEPVNGSGDLEAIEGIGSAYAERLVEAGVTDTAELADADPEDLAEETDIAEGRVRSWVERAGDGTAG